MYWYFIVSVKVTICNLLRSYIWQQGIQDSDRAPCGWWSDSGWWCSRNGTTSKAETSVVYLHYFVQVQQEPIVRDAGNTVYSVNFALWFFGPFLSAKGVAQSWIYLDTVMNRYFSSWDRIMIVLNLSKLKFAGW